jgi:hypothetical protein
MTHTPTTLVFCLSFFVFLKAARTAINHGKKLQRMSGETRGTEGEREFLPAGNWISMERSIHVFVTDNSSKENLHKSEQNL